MVVPASRSSIPITSARMPAAAAFPSQQQHSRPRQQQQHSRRAPGCRRRCRRHRRRRQAAAIILRVTLKKIFGFIMSHEPCRPRPPDASRRRRRRRRAQVGRGGARLRPVRGAPVTPSAPRLPGWRSSGGRRQSDPAGAVGHTHAHAGRGESPLSPRQQPRRWESPLMRVIEGYISLPQMVRAAARSWPQTSVETLILQPLPVST